MTVGEAWLIGANVVDVRSGAVARDQAVGLVGGRIAAVLDGLPAPMRWGVPGSPASSGVPVVDLRGRYLVPGLVTVHTHLSIVFPFSDTDEAEDPALTAFRAASRATSALQAGATTVRCVHEQHRVDIRLREAAARGWFVGPRIVAGGRALSAPGGHGRGSGAVYCTGPEEYYAAAMAELDAGADHIKVFITGGLAHAGESPAEPEMTPAEMAAVVRAAEAHGTYVVDEPTAAVLAQPGVYVTPTLVVTRCQDWMERNGFEAHSRANARVAAVDHAASAARLVAAGVAVVNGTDVPAGDETDDTSAVVREAELLMEAGLSPLEALRASTLTPAQLCGLSDVGVVAPDFAADLLVLDQDPTRSPWALRTVRAVIAAGRVVRDDLRILGALT